MLIQAGQSGRGQAFAAQWAELVFVIYHNLEAGKQQYAAFKQAVASAGRDPDQVNVAPACYVIVAESEEAAQAKQAVIEASAKPIDALVLISEVLNYDFGAKGYDEPFSDEELAGFSWHGFRERVVKFSGKKNPTVRDFVEVSGRGYYCRAQGVLWDTEIGGRPDGGMVYRAGLRRIRSRGDPYAGYV